MPHVHIFKVLSCAVLLCLTSLQCTCLRLLPTTQLANIAPSNVLQGVTFAAGAGGGLGGATGTGLGSSLEPKLGTCTFSNFGASNLGIWKGSDGFSGAAAGAGVGGGVLGAAGLCAFSGSCDCTSNHSQSTLVVLCSDYTPQKRK